MNMKQQQNEADGHLRNSWRKPVSMPLTPPRILNGLA